VVENVGESLKLCTMMAEQQTKHAKSVSHTCVCVCVCLCISGLITVSNEGSRVN